MFPHGKPAFCISRSAFSSGFVAYARILSNLSPYPNGATGSTRQDLSSLQHKTDLRLPQSWAELREDVAGRNAVAKFLEMRLDSYNSTWPRHDNGLVDASCWGAHGDNLEDHKEGGQHGCPEIGVEAGPPQVSGRLPIADDLRARLDYRMLCGTVLVEHCGRQRSCTGL